MLNYILFIDSGIGGLSTLAETMKKTKANYLYYADTKNAPYGNKSDEFIQNRLADIVRNFTNKYNISMVVLACNTATTTAISYLRNKFKNLVFVGTEPALKIAQDNKFIHPAVIATPQTILHLKPQILRNISSIPCSKLASNIECYFIEGTIKAKYLLLKNIYSLRAKLKPCDCLILGCTHYSFLKETFAKVLNIPILDGNQGVAKRIGDILQNKETKSSVKIAISSKNSRESQKYKKILNQILANQINLW